MSAINDLTPEEEAAFAQHGVESAGPGVEPNGEPSPGQEAVAAPAAPEPPRDERGRFAPAPAVEEAAPAAAEAVTPAADATAARQPAAPPRMARTRKAAHRRRQISSAEGAGTHNTTTGRARQMNPTKNPSLA